MCEQFIRIIDEEGRQPMELPIEADGTLLLSTLSAQFTGACGLKYYNPNTDSTRGVRLCEGRFYPPDGVWGCQDYTIVYPKNSDNKRKIDNPGGTVSAPAPAAKSACTDKKCSDLIVLGLPFKCTEDEMRQYFETFGEVVLCQIKRDPHTNNSKGYGFVRFDDFKAQIQVLAQKRHSIEGRWCDVRIPYSKEGTEVPPCRKVFVGRCTEDMTTDDLRSFFSKYGEILDVYIPRPFRAFAFVTFADANVAQSLCGEDFLIKGTSVHVGTATPKSTAPSRHPTYSYSSGRAGILGPPGTMAPDWTPAV